MLVPLAMGFDLAQAILLSQEGGRGLAAMFETRDPNPNPSMPARRPSPTPFLLTPGRTCSSSTSASDLNSYAKLMKKAQAAGTYVILADNLANFPVDALSV